MVRRWGFNWVRVRRVYRPIANSDAVVQRAVAVCTASQ